MNVNLPVYSDGNRFEIIQEQKRLKEDEINMATNYGFKTAKMMMDKGDHKLKPEVLVDNLGNKKYRYILKEGEQTKSQKQIVEQASDLKKRSHCIVKL